MKLGSCNLFNSEPSDIYLLLQHCKCIRGWPNGTFKCRKGTILCHYKNNFIDEWKVKPIPADAGRWFISTFTNNCQVKTTTLLLYCSNTDDDSFIRAVRLIDNLQYWYYMQTIIVMNGWTKWHTATDFEESDGDNYVKPYINQLSKL